MIADLDIRRTLSSPRFLIGVGLSLLAIFLLARLIDWRLALTYISGARLPWLFLALLSMFANDLAKAARWYQLFPAGNKPRFRDVFGAYMAGRLINSVVPFRGGDFTRAYLMGGRRGHSTATMIGSIGAEKYIDLLILGLLAFIVLPMVVLPDEILNADSWWVGVVIGVILWTGFVVLLPQIRIILDRIGGRVPAIASASDLAGRLVQGFASLRQSAIWPALMVFSLIVLASALFTNIAVLQALTLPSSLLLAALVLVIIQFGISVPSTVGQIGVFEWLAILALSLGGIDQEPALAFALVLHAIVLLGPLFIGVPWLLYRA